MAHLTHASRRDGPDDASPASWLLFAVLFAVFLTVALAASMLTLRWRGWLPGAEGERSLIGGVTTAVYTAMSHVI